MASGAAALVFGCCLLLTAAAVVLDVLNSGTDVPGGTYRAWTSAAAGLALAVPGCLILRRLGSHVLGWVMAGGGLLWCVDALASGWSVYAAYTEPGTPGAAAAYFFLMRVGAVLLLPLPSPPAGPAARGRRACPTRWRPASARGFGVRRCRVTDVSGACGSRVVGVPVPAR